MRTRHVRTCGWILLLAAVLCLPLPGHAQQTTLPNGAPQSPAVAKSKRRLAKVSKPADFTGAGLLQFEQGYDGDFRAPDTSRDQAGTASLLFNATEDLQLEIDFDLFHSLMNSRGQTATGIGDTYANVQATVRAEGPRLPSLGFAYQVKLPTASPSAGLGTGRVDHKLRLLTSRKAGRWDVDLNAAALVNGNPARRGWETGYQIALGFSRGIRPGVSLEGELFGETLDTDQPRGLFAQGGLTYQPTDRVSLDLGVRAGLTSSAPRFGVFAGISLGLAKLYHSETVK